MVLETGKGHSIIQGSAYIDDKTEDGCTLIIKGFHHQIKLWWSDVEKRHEREG